MRCGVSVLRAAACARTLMSESTRTAPLKGGGVTGVATRGGGGAGAVTGSSHAAGVAGAGVAAAAPRTRLLLAGVTAAASLSRPRLRLGKARVNSVAIAL
jgi:hypothetical protein